MAARNMFIEIYEYPYKFMTFARMLGRPHGGAPTGLCRNSQKINSFKKRGILFSQRFFSMTGISMLCVEIEPRRN